MEHGLEKVLVGLFRKFICAVFASQWMSLWDLINLPQPIEEIKKGKLFRLK